jgi:WD40 repeat protein
LKLFDLNKETTIKSWNNCHSHDVTRCLYCPQSNLYLSASRDKTIKIWKNNSSSLDDKPQNTLVGHDLVVTTISTDPQNRHLISGSRDLTLKLWDLSRCELVKNMAISRNLVIFQQNIFLSILINV